MIVGCGYIVLSKFKDLGALYVTAVPVLIMIGYALILATARLFRLRDDQSGDNLYYMGFLFTLTSLAVSLYQFSATGSAEQIVQKLRCGYRLNDCRDRAEEIFFNQMRRDPIEVEATARMELAEASRRVRRELEGTILEFSYFRRMTQQSVAEALEQANELLKETTQKLGEELSKAASSANKPIGKHQNGRANSLEELNSRVMHSLDLISKKFTQDGEQLSKTMSAAAKAIETVVSKLAAMQTPDSIIEIKLQPMVQGLSRAVNSFSKSSETNQQTIESTLVQTQALATSIAELIKEIRAERAVTANKSTIAPWGR